MATRLMMPVRAPIETASTAALAVRAVGLYCIAGFSPCSSALLMEPLVGHADGPARVGVGGVVVKRGLEALDGFV